MLAQTHPRTLHALLLLAVLGFSGCGTLQTGDSSIIAAGDRRLPSILGEDDPNLPTFSVEVRPYEGTPQKAVIPHRGTIYVQDVLRKTGVHRKFNRIKLYVVRRMPDGQGEHRLEVRFDHNSNSVPAQYDYAIHPGDTILVLEDPTTFIDELLESVGASIFF